ncbi:glycosyltransferase family 1 protein [Candidatus Kaiserbacteria bacterium]|nr:glycosyltransferase family 1 protein [Candidatus Kaiserbacteria bacterium]
MKILYVTRGDLKTSFLKQKYHSFRRSLYFCDQDGFFEQSLYSVADVDEISIDTLYREDFNQKYDLLLVNWKQPGFSSEQERFSAIKKIIDKCALPKALFINAANANYLPEEGVLDTFDFIIKREPFADRNKYNISEVNKTKIIPTIIDCPLIHSPKSGILGKISSFFAKTYQVCELRDEVFDVGFSGADAAEHSMRRDAVQAAIDAGYKFCGGLQKNPYTKEVLPEKLVGERMKGQDYRDAICNTKINLAIDGIGQYTFRHQELFYLGAFVLSTDTINSQELIIPVVDGVHYVSYKNTEDMLDKIRYYIEHEDERVKIAKEGKKIFDEFYDPIKHGQTLLARLKK